MCHLFPILYHLGRFYQRMSSQGFPLWGHRSPLVQHSPIIPPLLLHVRLTPPPHGTWYHKLRLHRTLRFHLQFFSSGSSSRDIESLWEYTVLSPLPHWFLLLSPHYTLYHYHINFYLWVWFLFFLGSIMWLKITFSTVLKFPYTRTIILKWCILGYLCIFQEQHTPVPDVFV